MRPAPPLVAQPLIDFTAALDGCDRVALGVDCHGAVYAVGHAAAGARILAWQPGDPPDTLRRLTLPEADAPFDFVQPLPGGVLLARARCDTRPGRDARNALVVDWDGRARARFTLGDGIQDLRVTPDGTIWVSYFDEGVFGSGTPVGAAGLVAFSSAGDPRFAYRADAAGTDSICDAYALNVSGDDDAWVYFYTEFPIVRIHGGRYHVWHTSVTGASALAVRGKRALLYGGYRERGVARVLELGAKGSATIAATHALVDSDGAPLTDAHCHGVGAGLYVLGQRAVALVREW